jgi:hypothetical protein
MMPCSSGNSPTMSVSRSALASSAARSACAGQRGAAELRPMARAMRAHTLDAFALACPACRGRPPWPARHARLQRLLAVLVEEELGVGQARPHHAFVALDHARRVGRADVADDRGSGSSAARRRPAAGSTSGWPSSSGSGIPAARPGTRARSGTAARSGRSTSAVTSSSSASSSMGTRPSAAAAAASWRTISARRARQAGDHGAFVAQLAA